MGRDEERIVKIAFSGVIGRLPVGGHAWIAMQYLAGLHALGHDVVFLEDCGEESWVYDWDREALTTDLAYPAAYVGECLEPLGLGRRWIYRAGDRAAGMDLTTFLDWCRTADLLVVWAVPLAWRPEYERFRRRAFIDADPGFTQMRLANGDRELAETIDRCDRLFTIAQRMGAPDCAIPGDPGRWRRTVPPVVPSLWPRADGPATHFTTIMQWRGYRDVEYDGATYGQKDREFPRFIGLPSLTPQPFRIALTGRAPGDLAASGWDVVPGWQVSRTPESYRAFIQGSRAEICVAKHGYVAMRGGWFSDRSVCYLAAGRPVLVEDTGLADWLPVGDGIVTFHDLPSAAAGVEAINAAYDRHRRAARALAETRFSFHRVLPALVDESVQ
jgi:hypothetical protein